MGKLYERIFKSRLRVYIEKLHENTQCGFIRMNRGTQDHIFTMRQMCVRAIRARRDIHMCFIDMEKENLKSLSCRIQETYNIIGVIELYYVDDMMMVAETEHDLQHDLIIMNSEFKKKATNMYKKAQDKNNSARDKQHNA